MTGSTAQPHVLLVGCGNMGGAMLKGWLQEGKYRISVIDPHPAPENTKRDDLEIYTSADDFSQNGTQADIVILAVKPQILADVAPSIVPCLTEDTIILSIAAGQPIKTLENLFGAQHKIIRSMPNTPSQIGRGMTVLSPNGLCDEHAVALAEDLMSSIGDVLVIEDETLMNAVTAVSGSGPAYVFLLIEALESAAISAGLSEETARRLARRTITGSAALAAANDDTDAATLRQNVTSPGGTTEAALDILMEPQSGLVDLMDRAVQNAVQRGIDLGKKDT